MLKSIKHIELRVTRERVAAYLPRMDCAADAAKLARQLIGDSEQEHALVFFLDASNKITGYTLVGKGGQHACIVEPRDVFRTAIHHGAAAVVLAHNHPSQDVTPSIEDLRLTKNLAQCAAMLCIPMHDHVIVTSNDDFYSIRDKTSILG